MKEMSVEERRKKNHAYYWDKKYRYDYFNYLTMVMFRGKASSRGERYTNKDVSMALGCGYNIATYVMNGARQLNIGDIAKLCNYFSIDPLIWAMNSKYIFLVLCKKMTDEEVEAVLQGKSWKFNDGPDYINE